MSSLYARLIDLDLDTLAAHLLDKTTPDMSTLARALCSLETTAVRAERFGCLSVADNFRRDVARIAHHWGLK